jgi:predicted HAD superfamily hydrolase
MWLRNRQRGGEMIVAVPFLKLIIMKIEIDIKDLVELCRAFQNNIGDDADEAYIRMWLDKREVDDCTDKMLNKVMEELQLCKREIDRVWKKIK